MDLDLFRPTRSAVLDERVAERLRDPDHFWFSLTTVVRNVVVNNSRVDSADRAAIVDYASLAEMRDGGNDCACPRQELPVIYRCLRR